MTNPNDWLLDFRGWLTAVLSDAGISMQGAGVEAGVGLYAVRGILRRGNTPQPKTVRGLVERFQAPSERAERWEQGARDALSRKTLKIKATRERRHPERYKRVESVCLHCNKLLELRRCHVGKKMYCSRACAYAARRKKRLSDRLRIYLWHEMAEVRGITSYMGMASAWGMSYGGLARYFGTEGRLLKRSTLVKIATYLGVEAEYLISLQGGITADDRISERAREWMLTLIQTVPRGPLSPETRTKISAAHQDKPWSPERKAAYHEAVWGDKAKAAARHKKVVEASKTIKARLLRSLGTYCQHLGREPTSDELESFADRKVRDLTLLSGSQSSVLNLFKEKLDRAVPVGGAPELKKRYAFVRQLRDNRPKETWKDIARAVETKERLPEYSIDHESLRVWFSRFSKRQATRSIVASQPTAP